MPKLVVISGTRLVKLLQSIGFRVMRIKGSHHFLYHADTKFTAVVPVHAKEDIGPGLLRAILRDIEMSVDQYDTLRKRKKK